jgi:hypothetical protein
LLLDEDSHIRECERNSLEVVSYWTRMGYMDAGERLLTNYDIKEIPLIKSLK